MSASAALAILSGAMSGFALGLVGGGGSILAVPLLLYVVGITKPHVAIGTGAVAVAVAALFSCATHAKAGNIRWRSATVFAAVGVVGALLGSAAGKAVNGQRLLFLFGLLMIVVGVSMLHRSDDKDRAPRYANRSDLAVAGLALLAGMASGFFGIGGGFLIVPCLLFATRMTPIDAIGSSLLAVAAFSLATAANYAYSGLIDWPIAGWFVLGGIVGGGLGMTLAVRLGERKGTLRRVLAFPVLAIAAFVIIRSIGVMTRA